MSCTTYSRTPNTPMTTDHAHDHDHDHARDLRTTRSRALWLVLVLNGAFLLVELVGGIAFGSLALLADAVHMASDVGALTIALVALAVAARPASSRHTYGLKRAEVLGAQLNAVILIAAAVWIAVEAVRRLGEDVTIDGWGVTAVASVGLVVNVVSAVVLARNAGGSLNMRGVFWHMVSDALGSVAAIAAGLAVVWWDATWVDSVASLLVAALVTAAGWRLLRDTTRVLLEGTPPHLDVDDIAAAIVADVNVGAVHDLHVWSLDAETSALSAHVVVENEPTLHDAQHVADRLKQMLADRFGVEHSTLEVECHDCATAPHDGAASRPT